MSEELYLIAHRVRGKAAFDVATRVQIGDEEGWIIPTSGHRAYPYWSNVINLREDGSLDIPESPYTVCVRWDLPEMPDDLPDHYPTNLNESTISTDEIFAVLGLPAKGELRRRV